MFVTQSLQSFLESLAAKSPSPGGGACSAITGALAAAQAEMCARYSSDPIRFGARAADAEQLTTRFNLGWKRFMELAELDASAFLAWQEARRLPRGTDEEKKIRKNQLAQSQAQSIEVPEQMLALCLKQLEALSQLVEFANPQLIPDIHVAAQGFNACAEGAHIQVLGNLGTERTDVLTDRASAAKNSRSRARTLALQIKCSVLAKMGWPADTDISD